jgi:hypothetical protein
VFNNIGYVSLTSCVRRVTVTCTSLFLVLLTCSKDDPVSAVMLPDVVPVLSDISCQYCRNSVTYDSEINFCYCYVIWTVFLSNNIEVNIYGSIILRIVLYRCETWSLTLREEHMLGADENRILSKILEPKIDDVRGNCWRLLINV